MPESEFVGRILAVIVTSVAVSLPFTIYTTKKLMRWAEKKIDEIVKEELKKCGLY